MPFGKGFGWLLLKKKKPIKIGVRLSLLIALRQLSHHIVY